MEDGGIHASTIEQSGFEETPCPAGFGPLWKSYASSGGFAHGYYHLCAPSDRWNIAIHDFTLEKDALLEFKLPEYLSITWYESISGEELTPYRKLRSKALWGFCSDKGGWRGLVHGGVPIRAIGIEVTPRMSAEYLESEYEGQFENVRDAFLSVNDMHAFPEMRALLASLYPHPGDESKSQLFYEGKVLEALGLLVERTRASHREPCARLSEEDARRIRAVISYIDDHAAGNLLVPDLARAACMSPTKFKESFRIETGSTFTAYVQRRRVSMAESLLRQPDLTIAQVARAVGYTCSGRFSKIFQRETGMLPSEYRNTLAHRP